MSATENELGLLHQLIAETLRDKIKSGEYSASDISNAIKFLKDNNITCSPGEDNALSELEKALAKSKVPPASVEDLADALNNISFNEAH